MTGLAVVLLVLSASSAQKKQQCGLASAPHFSDFSASSKLRGKPAHPVLRTAIEHEYRTTIRSAARSGPNFDGHYAVALYGCGSGCHGFFVIDLQSGAIFDPPFKSVNFHYPRRNAFVDSDPDWWCFPRVIEFRRDSALLIVEGCLDDHQCGRTFYSMGRTGLRQVRHYPDLLPDGKVAPF